MKSYLMTNREIIVNNREVVMRGELRYFQGLENQFVHIRKNLAFIMLEVFLPIYSLA